MIHFKELTSQDLTEDLLLKFQHQQKITKKWVKFDDQWEIVTVNDLRTWEPEKRRWISEYLRQQIERGGSVIAAFDGETIVGFCSIDGGLRGITANYSNLTMLFVDDRWKRNGVGKALFNEICLCARERKAEKLFISAIPSFETVAFYFSVGCVEAREHISAYIDTEQDRCLEYVLR